MRLYEFEGKALFVSAGIPCPEGKLCRNIEEVEPIIKEIGLPAVLKAQVLTGGRGKSGGIKVVTSLEEAKETVKNLFQLKIKGFLVNKILVEKKISISKELYLGVTIDRFLDQIVIIASNEGGVEIETIAKTAPEKIKKIYKHIDEEIFSYELIKLWKELGFSGKILVALAKIGVKLFGLFTKYDAKLMEINPLAITEEGEVLALDSRISLDEDAMFRQSELAKMQIEDRHEEGELTPREKEAKEAGIPYLDLDGNIGMFPGGAGFGIASIDLIKELGGKPANFMDSGGGPTPERIAKMINLLVENPAVDAIFGARFGGVSRCDEFAKGMVMFLRKTQKRKPMAIRMTGNMWKEGMEIFAKARQETPEIFEGIEIYGIETPIEDVAKRAIELAQEASKLRKS